MNNIKNNKIKLLSKVAYPNDTGWLSKCSETEEVISFANQLRNNFDTLVVIGIGGSYLGAKAIIEALSKKFNREKEVIFVGDSLSEVDLLETIEYLEDKKFIVNVISKSGTTLETNLAYNAIKDLLIKKLSKDEIRNHIVFTTDAEHGKLREEAIENDYKTFTIPNDVGGRYSVFTAVGLLPVAFVGIDVRRILSGVSTATEDSFTNTDVENYVGWRLLNYSKGKSIELFCFYEPRMRFVGEWLKQLFAESEGKDGKGIFPSSAIFSTDLHSIGQMIQDGEKNIMESHVSFKNVSISNNMNRLTHFDSLSTKTLNGVVKAHNAGGVPTSIFEFDNLDEYTIGYLMQFYMISCGVSAMTIGVNPFDQPGVEAYKKEIKELL